jgi:hypothetical protein
MAVVAMHARMLKTAWRASRPPPETNLSSQFELKVGLDMSRYGWPIGAVDKRWPFNFFSHPGCFETAVTPGSETEFV